MKLIYLNSSNTQVKVGNYWSRPELEHIVKSLFIESYIRTSKYGNKVYIDRRRYSNLWFNAEQYKLFK